MLIFAVRLCKAESANKILYDIVNQLFTYKYSKIPFEGVTSGFLGAATGIFSSGTGFFRASGTLKINNSVYVL